MAAGSVGRRAFAGWLTTAAGVAGLDQLTKAWALAALDGVVPVLPFLNFVLVHNPGAVFGLLARAGGWQRWMFVVAGAAAAAFIVVWLRRTRADERWLPAGLALVLGGAIGNLWDRIVRGAVVDFIHLHQGRYHWPAFNVADSAITAGVVIIVLISFRGGPAERRR